MTEEVIILVTAGTQEEAEKISEDLVAKKLIACANVVSGVHSIFRWQGETCREAEMLLIMKSVSGRVEQIIERVKELHSYQVPEVLVLPIIAGSQEYLNWLKTETFNN